MPPAQLAARPSRFDPYKNYRFLLKWNNRYVAGISKVSGLSHTGSLTTPSPTTGTAPVRVSPGQTQYEAVTLEQGVTLDPEFQAWASKIWDYKNSTQSAEGGNGIKPLDNFRRDLTLELHNEAGQTVLAYTIYRCWVSEFSALPELDGMGNAVAIQHIKLENEGFERDPAIIPPEPASPPDQQSSS